MLKAMLEKKILRKIIVLRSSCLNLGKENGKFFNGKAFLLFCLFVCLFSMKNGSTSRDGGFVVNV